jgi:hypothetical protein
MTAGEAPATPALPEVRQSSRQAEDDGAGGPAKRFKRVRATGLRDTPDDLELSAQTERIKRVREAKVGEITKRDFSGPLRSGTLTRAPPAYR